MTLRIQPARKPYSKKVQAVLDRFPRSWLPPFPLFASSVALPADVFERYHRHQEIFMSVAANKKLIQQIYADSASRSGTTFADSLAEDVRWIVTGQYSWSRSVEGRAAVLDFMSIFRSLFDIRPRTVAFNFIAEGDTVVVEAKGDNLTSRGVRYDNDYCMIWRIEDGRIKMIKEYCDSALVEKVLGPFPQG